jgi:hypothetical protein
MNHVKLKIITITILWLTNQVNPTGSKAFIVQDKKQHKESLKKIKNQYNKKSSPIFWESLSEQTLTIILD